MCKALSFLDSLQSAALHADPMPIPQALHPLAERMASLSYDNLAILGAVADAQRHGTLRKSPSVDDEDREQLEELLPTTTEDRR